MGSESSSLAQFMGTLDVEIARANAGLRDLIQNGVVMQGGLGAAFSEVADRAAALAPAVAAGHSVFKTFSTTAKEFEGVSKLLGTSLKDVQSRMADAFTSEVLDPGKWTLATEAVGKFSSTALQSVGFISEAGGGMQRVQSAASTLGPVFASVAGGVKGVGMALKAAFLTNPVGIAISALTTAFSVFQASQAQAKASIEEFKDALDSETGAITEATRKMAMQKVADVLPESSWQNLERFGIHMSDATDAILLGGDAARDYFLRLDEVATGTTEFGTVTQQEAAALYGLAREVQNSSGYLDDAQASTARFTTEMSRASSVTTELTAEQQRQAEAAAAARRELEGQAIAFGFLADASGTSDADLKDFIDTQMRTREELASAAGSFVSLSSAYDTVAEAADNGVVSMAAWLDELESQAQAQSAWAVNLATIADRAGQDFAAELAKMGPAGGQQVALAANATDEELQRLVGFFTERGGEATERWVQELADPRYTEALHQIGSMYGTGLMEAAELSLQEGTTTIQGLVDQYGLIVGSSSPQMQVDRTAVESAIQATLDELAMLGTTTADPVINAQRADLDAKLAQSYADLEALNQQYAAPIFGATAEQFNATAAQVQENLWLMSQMQARPGFSANNADFLALSAQTQAAILTLDGSRATPMVTVEVADASAKVKSFGDQWSTLTSKSITLTTKLTTLREGSAINGNGLWATGGPIIGPGTGTSDSIPAMLSNGEHVITAREVIAAGGHAAVEQWRAGLLASSTARVNVERPSLKPVGHMEVYANSTTVDSAAIANAVAAALDGLPISLQVGERQMDAFIDTKFTSAARGLFAGRA